MFSPKSIFHNLFTADTEDSGMSSGEADIMAKWNKYEEGKQLGR